MQKLQLYVIIKFSGFTFMDNPIVSEQPMGIHNKREEEQNYFYYYLFCMSSSEGEYTPHEYMTQVDHI